jgi:PUA domain protein
MKKTEKMKVERLRKKEVKRILKEIENYGISVEKGSIDRVRMDDLNLLLFNGEPAFIEYGNRIYFTVYGVMMFKPEKWKVVVDEGAMPYIINGADVMKPGIVWADKGIKEGDFVYITVIGKKSPIAVGIALCDGEEMVRTGKGKAIKNIHHLKDKIWNSFFGQS